MSGVFVQSIGISIPHDIKPMTTPPFSVMSRRQQCLDLFEETILRVEHGGRQTHQGKRKSAFENALDCPIGSGNALAFEFGQNEGVDTVSNP